MSSHLLVLLVVFCVVPGDCLARKQYGLRRKVQACGPKDTSATPALVGTSSNRLSLFSTGSVVSSKDEGPKIEPTYKYMGCYKIENGEEERLKPGTPISSNSETKCYDFCHGEEKKDENSAKFFLLKGGECTCLPYINKNPSPGATCSDPCPGDKKEKCGGPGVESVFVMVDCPVLPKSKVQIVKDKQMQETLKKNGLAA